MYNFSRRVIGIAIASTVVFLSASLITLATPDTADAAGPCLVIKTKTEGIRYKDCDNRTSGDTARSTDNGTTYSFDYNVEQGGTVGTVQCRGTVTVATKKMRSSCYSNQTFDYTVIDESSGSGGNNGGGNNGGGGGTGAPGGEAEDDGQNDTTCFIKGVGWLVCPVVNFLSWIADLMYQFFTDFLVVPASLYTNDALRSAHNSFLAFANTLFVIAFMVVIYSQLTGGGLSAYTLKRMFPRIIATALLVNLSWLLCTLAIDVSNVVGSNLKDFLAGAVDLGDVANMDDPSKTMWSNLAVSVLAGGAAIGAVGAAGGLFPALVILVLALIPVIITLIMILFFLLIRQAAIILLVAVAPVAFALNLLPNTEKWFAKWRQMFTAVLMVYPIVGGIYGASLLAASILQSAYAGAGDSAGGFDEDTVSILAAAIVVIPLFIVPKTLKASLDGLGKLGATLNGMGSKVSGNLSSRAKNSGLAKHATSVGMRRKALAKAGIGNGLRARATRGINTGTGRIARSMRALRGTADSATSGYISKSAAAGAGQALSQKKEDIQNAEALLMQSTNGNVGSLQKSLTSALRAGDTDTAMAAQNMLLSRGESGADAWAEAINEAAKKGKNGEAAMSAGTAEAVAAEAMNSHAQTIKAARMDGFKWAMGKGQGSIEDHTKQASTWQGLSPERAATQTTKSLQGANDFGHHAAYSDAAAMAARTPELSMKFDKNKSAALGGETTAQYKARTENPNAHTTAVSSERAQASGQAHTAPHSTTAAVSGATPMTAPATTDDSSITQAAATAQAPTSETVQRINHAQDSQPVVPTPPAPSSRPTPPQPPTPPPSA